MRLLQQQAGSRIQIRKLLEQIEKTEPKENPPEIDQKVQMLMDMAEGAQKKALLELEALEVKIAQAKKKQRRRQSCLEEARRTRSAGGRGKQTFTANAAPKRSSFRKQEKPYGKMAGIA